MGTLTPTMTPTPVVVPETVAQVRDYLAALPEGEVLDLHDSMECLGARLMRALNPGTEVHHGWVAGDLLTAEGETRRYAFTGAVDLYFIALSDVAFERADRTAGDLLALTDTYLRAGAEAMLDAAG